MSVKANLADLEVGYDIPAVPGMDEADIQTPCLILDLDALERNESCGGHFREEYQTPEGEAARDDERYSYVAAWEFTGVGKEPVLHREPLAFEYVHPAQRSYK